VEVGPGVTSLQPGDDVALEPGIPCWFNRASREGRYNIDPDIKFFATPPVHASLAEVAHRASRVLTRGAAPFAERQAHSCTAEQGWATTSVHSAQATSRPCVPAHTCLCRHRQCLSSGTTSRAGPLGALGLARSLWTTQPTSASACHPA